MDNIQDIQFFVLDVSVIILTIVVLALSAAVYHLLKKSREQQKYNASMEKTIDRILKIDAGAGGGIDGWEMALQDRKKTEVNTNKRPKHK